MSEWRDRRQGASFRGVPFWVDYDGVNVGRRTQVHEYPQRDQPMVEDLGRRTRRYQFAGFVVGSDCLEQRDNLLKALDQPGSGELVHPWFGRLRVTAGDCSISHARNEGGMVRFDLVFIDGMLEFPVQSANTRRQLAAQAPMLLESIKARFNAAMAPINLAGQQVRALRTALSSVYAFGINFLNPLTSLVGDVDAFVYALVNAPESFAASLLSDLASMERAFDGYGTGSSLNKSRSMAEQSMSLPREAPVSASADEVVILAAVVALIQDATVLNLVLDMAQVPIAGVATVTAPASLDAQLSQQGTTAVVGTSPTVTGASVVQEVGRASVPVANDILQLRDAISEAIWAVAAQSPADHFRVLSDTRVASDRHLTEVARSGVWLRNFAPAETLPALVLAYSLYGDAFRGLEIVSRNRIRHPGFVPATELQVAKS